jgi:hypothetical protein
MVTNSVESSSSVESPISSALPAVQLLRKRNVEDQGRAQSAPAQGLLCPPDAEGLKRYVTSNSRRLIPTDDDDAEPLPSNGGGEVEADLRSGLELGTRLELLEQEVKSLREEIDRNDSDLFWFRTGVMVLAMVVLGVFLKASMVHVWNRRRVEDLYEFTRAKFPEAGLPSEEERNVAPLLPFHVVKSFLLNLLLFLCQKGGEVLWTIFQKGFVFFSFVGVLYLVTTRHSRVGSAAPEATSPRQTVVDAVEPPGRSESSPLPDAAPEGD